MHDNQSINVPRTTKSLKIWIWDPWGSHSTIRNFVTYKVNDGFNNTNNRKILIMDSLIVLSPTTVDISNSSRPEKKRETISSIKFLSQKEPSILVPHPSWIITECNNIIPKSLGNRACKGQMIPHQFDDRTNTQD